MKRDVKENLGVEGVRKDLEIKGDGAGERKMREG